MTSAISIPRGTFFGVGVMFAMGACSASGSSTVGLYMTDAPPDMNQISSVVVNVNKVDVHVVDMSSTANGDPNDSSIDNDSLWHTIPLQDTEFDLVKLQNNATAFMGAVDVSPGKITQIRLFVDPNAQNVVHLTSGVSCAIDTSRVSRTGIKIIQPFKALPALDGNTTNVVIDFDLQNSLSQDGNCAFSLQPVIKIRACERDAGHKGPSSGHANGGATAPAIGASDAANPLSASHGGVPEDPNLND